MSHSSPLIAVTNDFRPDFRKMTFAPPVDRVYHPLDYAWEPYRSYLERYAVSPKRILFLGMNPGPWGMAQTGVPFGEIGAVAEWMGISGIVGRPEQEHPKRPVEGFSCTRSEVSGRRLWGLMRDRFGPADAFFSEHFVANYCPLVFLEESGRNRTPDKLPVAERRPLHQLCDELLRRTIEILEPVWLIGVGKFAEAQLARTAKTMNDRTYRIISIAHPSPANPRANRGWAQIVTETLEHAGVWSPRK